MSRTSSGHAPPSHPFPGTVHPTSQESSDGTKSTDPHHREKQILEIIQARAARIAFLNIDIFHDPAWDMLLALFAANLGQRNITVGSLSLASRVPASTAVRYMKSLAEEDLIITGAGGYDECADVELSKKGMAAMDSYFDYLNSGKFPEVISASRH